MSSTYFSEILFKVFLLSSPIWHFVTSDILKTYHSNEIVDVIEQSCLFLLNSHSSNSFQGKLLELSSVYINDSNVRIGMVNLEKFFWPNGDQLRLKGSINLHESDYNEILFFEKHKKDRTCLVKTTNNFNPLPEIFYGPYDILTMITFLNQKCNSFRIHTGSLSTAGLHRENILKNLFTMSSVSNSTMKNIKIMYLNNIFQQSTNKENIWPSESYCETTSDTPQCEHITQSHSSKYYPGGLKLDDIAQCERISYPFKSEDFFNLFIKQSKPVIIENATSHWAAISKWTVDYFQQHYGKNDVHIKLTPGGDFEGVEKAELWENYKSFKIPDFVREQLHYPDLVVVRPAPANMPFSDFLDLITMASQQENRNISAYLEYSSIPLYMPELEEDLTPFPFAKDLIRRHLNLWLSDGHTLGRLHFDQFENFLCQLRGRKQVILFEPYDNTRMYEAHIPQATLAFNKTSMTFRRAELEDTTSMVMSPIDLTNVDFKRFPKFSGMIPLNCTISEGEVLYLPAFWWHEVYSWPNTTEKTNMAVNFWYEPFLHKEYPCPECKLDVNPLYRHLL